MRCTIYGDSFFHQKIISTAHTYYCRQTKRTRGQMDVAQDTGPRECTLFASHGPSFTRRYISVVSTQKSLLTTWKFISVWEYILARRLTNRATGLDRISQSYEIDFDAKSKLQDLHFVDTSLNIRILFYIILYIRKSGYISESNCYKLHFSDFIEERVEKHFK